MPESALLKKLEIFASLSEAERTMFGTLSKDVRTVAARRNIIRDGERPEHLHLIVEGWAARYKLLADGSRQIVAFLIPGDFCDLHVMLLGKMDHGIQALTECRVAYLPSADVAQMTAGQNGLTRALWLSTLVDEAVLRSWIINNGRREAYGRVAHLLCELHLRMTIVGLVERNHFDLPLTQEDLADAAGLTPVHTNRVLQRLRKAGLIELGGRALTVLDVDAIRRAAGFDPSYLHIERRELA